METELGQLNVGLASAWRKAAIREAWRRNVDTATLQQSTLRKKKKWRMVTLWYGVKIRCWKSLLKWRLEKRERREKVRKIERKTLCVEV